MFSKKTLVLAVYSSATLLPALHANIASAAQIEEIVVTAQKRAESINDVGLTVQALSGEQLATQGITSVKDMVKAIPGLNYANSYYNTPVYTLRGVGFYENSLAAYPAVSVYVDEVPLVFPVFSSQAAIDVERVEVLKGPQGTLFGQNATGGTINYVAAKPSDTFETGADVSVNQYHQIDTSGFISGALSDTLNGSDPHQ
jgi:outer membrane receptor protein involved in Fe transport